MKEGPDYARDIAEIRSMMERSSKFLSLSGLAGVFAGIYALSGAFIAYKILDFNPRDTVYSSTPGSLPAGLMNVILTGVAVLVLAITTAILLSYRKANKKGERLWNDIARRVVVSMAVPLAAGGLLILIFIFNGLIGFIIPFTLLFYGLALFNASNFTYTEVKTLGLIEIGLGLISAAFIEYGLAFWALGFGVAHIIYGIYIHYRYER
ncbi:MAG: hypothetical protein WCF67_08310 [Chitinophagaceae bacterium]